MNGTSALDGKPLSGIDHLRQSVRDILTTPLGSRVMLRDYGSPLFELVDAPMNRSTIAAIRAATADALQKWEPRFKLTQVAINSAEPGEVALDLTGEYLPEGRTITLDGINVT
jgi:hypothetical protein